MSNNFKY